jgi:uncharacterized protein YwqG
MTDLAKIIRDHAQPAVHIQRSKQPTRSHFGGAPQLPAGVEWPEHNGKRLTLLARISLPEVHAAGAVDWLPRMGALLFFYDAEEEPWGFDPKDAGSARVLLVPDLAQPALADAGGPGDFDLATQPITFTAIQSPPGPDRDGFEIQEDEIERFEALGAQAYGGKPRHQIGGFPFCVQNDSMEMECQLVTHGLYLGDETGWNDPRAEQLAAGSADWRLLLQLDDDDEPGMPMWGDCGLLYFWIREQDAREGRFDSGWTILQCS